MESCGVPAKHRARDITGSTPWPPRSNVKIGGTLEEPDYIAALQSTSACLITQRPGVGTNFLPSKLLPALATGAPVLAVCERHSPLGTKVTAADFAVQA